MLNGQLPVFHQPKVAVVLIGTNDLYAMADCLDSQAELLDAVANITARLGPHTVLQ
jgi:hypothetical protein